MVIIKNIITGAEVTSMFPLSVDVSEYIKSLEDYYTSQNTQNTKSNEKYSVNYKFTEAQKVKIREYRAMGISIRELAEKYDCSVATIVKIVKGVDVDLRKKGAVKRRFKAK